MAGTSVVTHSILLEIAEIQLVLVDASVLMKDS